MRINTDSRHREKQFSLRLQQQHLVFINLFVYYEQVPSTIKYGTPIALFSSGNYFSRPMWFDSAAEEGAAG
jgi:hypothetical protein